MRFAFLAALRVGRDGDDGMVDRPEVADEGRVGLAVDAAGRDRLEEQLLAEVDHVDAGCADVTVAAFTIEFRPIETDAFVH